ncbi:M56 family metallopeptidase [Streptomyces sp. NPDC001276]|uniref:M56 family metallopeptidase n=1 Tax=Streptomyces sp. NPDC001276 TaxID=3364555 RepID=UPI0036AE7330
MVVAVVLAGLAVAVPTVPVSGSLAKVLQACAMALREQYAAPGGAVMAAGGTVLAVALVSRIAWCLGATLLHARRERSWHAEVLALVGSHRLELGVTVLDHERPAAYCLPGFRHRIVLTTAALAALDPAALQAVIAHERAHIRQRHHLVLAFAEGLQRAFPRLLLFRQAAEQTRQLVELAADDEAMSRSGALTLARALVEMAGAGAPAASLAASGGQVAGRVNRLLDPQRPLHRAAAWGGGLVAAAVLVLPLLLAAVPAVAATGMNACLFPAVPSEITSPAG